MLLWSYNVCLPALKIMLIPKARKPQILCPGRFFQWPVVPKTANKKKMLWLLFCGRRKECYELINPEIITVTFKNIHEQIRFVRKGILVMAKLNDLKGICKLRSSKKGGLKISSEEGGNKNFTLGFQ